MGSSELSWVGEWLAQFLKSPVWTTPVQGFIDDNCDLFEDCDVEENKLEYTIKHKEFCEVVDTLLTTNLDDIGVTGEQFLDVIGNTDNKELDRLVREYLLALDDFPTFRKMMEKRNVELELEAMCALETADAAEDHLMEMAIKASVMDQGVAKAEAHRADAELQHALAASLAAEEESQRRLEEELKAKHEANKEAQKKALEEAQKEHAERVRRLEEENLVQRIQAIQHAPEVKEVPVPEPEGVEMQDMTPKDASPPSPPPAAAPTPTPAAAAPPTPPQQQPQPPQQPAPLPPATTPSEPARPAPVAEPSKPPQTAPVVAAAAAAAVAVATQEAQQQAPAKQSAPTPQPPAVSASAPAPAPLAKAHALGSTASLGSPSTSSSKVALAPLGGASKGGKSGDVFAKKTALPSLPPGLSPSARPTFDQLKNAVVEQKEKTAAVAASVSGTALPSPPQNTAPSDDDLKRREDYLRSQRDRLIQQKKQDRQTELHAYIKEKTGTEEGTSGLAQAVSPEKPGAPVDQAAVDMRKALARKVKEDLLNGA